MARITMELFGGDEDAADEEPPEPADQPDAAESEQPTTAEAEAEAPEEAAEAEEEPAYEYLDYDRQDPPQAVRNTFGDRQGQIDDEVLDVLDAYVTADGTIREDVLELSLDQLEEWADVEDQVGGAKFLGSELSSIVDERTVNVLEGLSEDEFFQTEEGYHTLTNRYDLEKEVPLKKKQYFEEVDRYWVNEPFAFISIFKSVKENEHKYYIIEPYFTEEEEELFDFLSKKLRTAIKYESDDILAGENEDEDEKRRNVLDRESLRLLQRYDLYTGDRFQNGTGEQSSSFIDKLGPLSRLFGGSDAEEEDPGALQGLSVRPEHALMEETTSEFSEYQVKKLLYKIKRDFVGYERIDPIKHDLNIEEISVDGYREPVFVTHSDHDWIITNKIYEEEEALDRFVIKLAQRAGKGISKRNPQVDATAQDGSRLQLTLGREVSDFGTNYTIRQTQDVPLTPIDLINTHTFSLELMTYLWMAIETNRSLIFAGGTASGKTTNLNACSLFIPSSTKIVTIEDTREVTLPQRNWLASVTRPSFTEDEQGDIGWFDLLEAALRQRPEYIVMGETRGEEGRELFQMMSTGHTAYSTFHADTVGEVLKRFTTEPINVSKTLFTALDLVAIARMVRLEGDKLRKVVSLTEINEYNPEHDEINVQDIYKWRADTDEFENVGRSEKLEDIKYARGWSQERLEEELLKRQTVLAYLIDNSLNTYAQVAGAIQAFMADQDSILTLIANDALEPALDDLREMESVSIDIAPEKEEMITRFDPTDKTVEAVEATLEEARATILQEYEEREVESEAIQRALEKAVEEQEDIVVTPDDVSDGESPVPPEQSEADARSAEPDGVSAANGGLPDTGDEIERSDVEESEQVGASDNDEVADLFDDEESTEAAGSGEVEASGNDEVADLFDGEESTGTAEKGEVEESESDEVADSFDDEEAREETGADNGEIADLFGDDDAA